MKSSVLLLAIAAVALGSCSTVYKTGQTPDDVYYSPPRQTEEYVEVKKDEYRQSRGYQYDNPEDRYLRMKVRNPYRWNSFDDYYYNDWAYNSYGYNSYNPFFTWNTYWSWNSYYNPYCHNIVVVNPKSSPTVYSKVRNFSMNSYVNNTPKTTNTKFGVRPSSNYNNSNSNYNNTNNSLGTSIRKVFSGGNSNSNSGGSAGSYSTSSSNDRPVRTYNPSSSSSSNSSSGSSGSSGGGRSGGSSGGSSGGGVSRPGRGG